MKRTLMTAMTMIAAAGVVQGNELRAKECAIYTSASVAMAERGQTVQGLLTGCPLQMQVASANITRMANPPRYHGPLAGELYRSLVQRGIPTDLADQIAMSPAFGEWLKLRKSVK